MAPVGCYLNSVSDCIEKGDSEQLRVLRKTIQNEICSLNRVSEKELLKCLHSSKNLDVQSNHVAELWIPEKWKKMKFAALR